MNEGFWRYGDDGRPMYTDACGACGICTEEPWDKQHTYRDEFIGQIIDTVEDFLQENADHFRYLDWYAIENDPTEVIIHDHRYDLLYAAVSELLDTWEINL